MNFAIVRFVKEGGAPGIVSTNWLNEEKNICFFPNVGSEWTKNKLLVSRAEPTEDWLKCPVKMLKEFSNYQKAKNSISDAEETSNLDSDVEDTRSRKRRKRIIRLPGESSDDETDCEHIFMDYPVPPTTESSQSNSLLKGHKVDNSVSEDRGASLVESVDFIGPSQQSEGIFETLSPLKTSERAISVNLYPQATIDQLQNSIKEIESNQKSQLVFNTEIPIILSRLEAKIDILLSKNAEISTSSSDSLNDRELCLLTALPVNVEKFSELNDLINESQSFRQKFKKLLLVTGGKDSRLLACNLLKKIVVDDIADLYSLTGKSSSGQKLAFDKTVVYKVILEACIRVYGNSQECIVREAISDWLMQAKFRKSRREKRRSASANMPDPLNNNL